MLFTPKKVLPQEGKYLLPKNATALAHSCLNKEILGEFWQHFSFDSSTLTVSACEEYIFSVGNATIPSTDGNAYAISVSPNGIGIRGENEQALMEGFMTLLDRFRAADGEESIEVELDCCTLWDTPTIANRMVHYCIFPETELWELQRFLRLCGALKYTHVVLEFWGMLKYDCMQELSWSHGFTKEQIAPLIREANDLGLEIIPMFNHWGHASAGRVMHGKHVVLDQNPTLQTYFSEDGWCWDIKKSKVRELLRKIRRELTELCGKGSYFHIGCDEAYNFAFTKENMDALCDFINGLSEEMNAEGRRVIMWGDMLLYRYPYYKNKYSCNAPSPEVEQYFLEHLHKRIVIADWQYHAAEAPVETVSVFQKAGFDCLLCPWDDGLAPAEAALSTLNTHSLFGFMHTTWHTLTAGMPYVTMMAVGGFDGTVRHSKIALRTRTAALLRKVMPVNGDYEKAGWSKIEVSCRW